MEELTGWPEYSSAINEPVKKPDNPQAYPCLDSNGFALFMRDPGMTLRDWFAGQAIGAVIRQCASDGMLGFPDGVQTIEALFARNAYAIADAMLAERERQP